MRVGFWTPDLLKELDALYQDKTPDELSAHFGRSPRAIEEAYQFLIQHRELKISSRKKGKKRVTIYAPGHAEGAASHRSTAGRSY